MNILFLGDIVGRAGRDLIGAELPDLRRKLDADFVIVNGENAAGGFGITEPIATALFDAGVDVITTGNHIWDQREVIPYIERQPRLLRPVNFPPGTPGNGTGMFDDRNGRRVLTINLMGRLFMRPLDDPFAAMERELAACQLSDGADAIIVDFHAEATSEKMAMAHFCDGRASMVIGTHTHVPTADAQILPGGTACQTDAGMCGDYNSIIGMETAESLDRFVTGMNLRPLVPARGGGDLCGVFLQTDPDSGLARRFEPVRLGTRLAPAMPIPPNS